jgi:endonuclease G
MIRMKKRLESWQILLICLLLVAMMAGINYLLACGARNGAHAAESMPVENALKKKAKEVDWERPAKLYGVPEVMLQKSQFLISYNVERLCPNYVCWSLTEERVRGTVKRSDQFHADLSMDEAHRVDYFDYNGSGYDRGHMCPAGDNKHTEMAMEESFCMTNICPQDHDLNMEAWNDLEKKCRSWAKNDGTLYICCGPMFDVDSPKTIGRRRNMKIAVPDRFFKVVLMLGRVPKAIGFIYPNRACEGGLRDYAVSVDEVERQTGFDFFVHLDNQLEAQVEQACVPAVWGI